MKVYISGKITDNPNYKADFEAAELALKIAGFQPVNPAEEHMPDGATWADYEGTLKKQKEYDDQHREEINRKARARYRAKCGLKPIKEA